MQEREGYTLDIGDIFNKGFEIYKKTWAITGGGILLVGFIAIIVVLVFFSIILGISFTNLDTLDPYTFQTPSYFLRTLLFGLIVGAIFSPITAGFLKICKDAKDQKELSFGTIFQYYKAPYFGNIIIATILIAIVNGLFSYLFQFAIVVPFMNYVISIIMSSIQAIDFSIKLVGKNFFIVFVLMLLATILGFLGFLACGIGVFFTMPILYAVQFCIYDEILGKEEVSEIDMIGNGE